MYDLQKIGKLIADIERYIQELESYNLKKEDMSDSKNYNASSMLIFSILNKLIDIGGEIISAEKLGAPNSYQDIMPILAKGGIINKETAGKLNKIIRTRNVFAHFYEDVSKKELYEIIKQTPLIKDFLKTITKRIH